MAKRVMTEAQKKAMVAKRAETIAKKAQEKLIPPVEPLKNTLEQVGTNTPKENKNLTQGKSEPLQTNIEYKDHVIVTEPHGRVMVTKFGLHVVEFLGDIEKGIEKAKEYIEDACK